MGKAVKTISKIIPKEIKPALPFIASAFGAPYLAGSSFMTNAVANPFVRNLIAKGITSAVTSAATGGDTKQALRSGILAAAPDVLGAGLEKYAQTSLVPYGPQVGGSVSNILKGTQELATKGASALQPTTFMDTAKLVAGQAAIEGGTRLAELNEKALRDYESQLRSQGIADSAERRNQIFGYFSRAGYGDSEINAMLDKYGYAKGGRVQKISLEGFGKKFEDWKKSQDLARGGRVKYAKGGSRAILLASLVDKGMPYEQALKIVNEEIEEPFDVSGLQAGISGLETAFGRSFLDQPKPVPMLRLASGGIASTDESKVYMTDKDSGVIYRDPEGNPITKEEWLKRTQQEEDRQGKALGGILKKIGEQGIKQIKTKITQPIKRKVGKMTDDVEIDVNFDGDMYDDGTPYGITEINIFPKSKKGKEALDQAVKEGSAEVSSDGYYFIKDPEEVSGLLYEKGIKVSGVTKPTYKGNQFRRFDEGAKYSDSMDYGIPDYEIEMFENLARKRRAEGGIMNASHSGNDAFLEQRFDMYLEEGYSRDEAARKAYEDLQKGLFPTPELKNGGLMNLKSGGMPAEMDMRGGGFIPIGKQERADDVPARLSKNEFVMTADAVRAAGNGSINKGAKRMYDLMKSLEAK